MHLTLGILRCTAGVRRLDLLDGTHFSLDGVKLSANVSKEWIGALKELELKCKKLQEKLKRIMAEHAQADVEPALLLVRQKKRERRFQLTYHARGYLKPASQV